MLTGVPKNKPRVTSVKRRKLKRIETVLILLSDV